MSPLMVWTVIVFVPLALGAALRALLRRWRRAWWLSAVLALLTILAWMVTLHPPVSGSELYGLRTIQALAMTVGPPTTGLTLRLRRKSCPAPFKAKPPKSHGLRSFVIRPGGWKAPVPARR